MEYSNNSLIFEESVSSQIFNESTFSHSTHLDLSNKLSSNQEPFNKIKKPWEEMTSKQISNRRHNARKLRNKLKNVIIFYFNSISRLTFKYDLYY